RPCRGRGADEPVGGPVRCGDGAVRSGPATGVRAGRRGALVTALTLGVARALAAVHASLAIESDELAGGGGPDHQTCLGPLALDPLVRRVLLLIAGLMRS